ncbi:MAG TPA: metallopeptidase TldD-related protein [Candidatus Lokiarchaeia archaeon]|nr:metallopeptidase TldD-related protein [Candidatus Lokiarchaeia archaeon]
MSEQIEGIEQRLIAAGIAEYEIYLLHESNFEKQFLIDETDLTKEGHAWSYTVRVLAQEADRTGIGTVRSMSFRPEEVDTVVQQAVAMASLNAEPQYHFPPPAGAYPEVEGVEPAVKDDPAGVLSDQTEILLANVPKSGAIPTFGKLRLITDEQWLRNSSGVDASHASNHWFLEFALKAEQGTKKAEFWGTHYAARVADLNLAERIPTWGTYAQENLAAKMPEVEEGVTVVFPPKVLAEAFVPVIGHHASAAARHEGTTRFNEIGKQVAREDFSLWDDGLLAGGLGTAPWDGEGSPQQQSAIIADGAFQGWLYDQRHALIFGEPSTGNGVRGGAGQIDCDLHNLTCSTGAGTFADLIREIDHGLYVAQFSWLNPTELTGSFGAEIRNGYEIEGGELARPVKGGSVAGNVLSMLNDIVGLTTTTEIVPARDGNAGAKLPWMAFSNLKISQ